MACPHCGASVRPGLKRNAVAAVLAGASGVLLTLGINLPMLAVRQLDAEKSYSLLQGVGHLWHRGHIGLAVLIGGFSIVFPYAKIIMIMLATSAIAPLTPRGRRRLSKVAAATGKYSLLDVLVVAVTVFALQFNDNLLSARPDFGLWLFAGAVAMSMAAGWVSKVGE